MSDQTQKQPTRPSDLLEPVHAGKTVRASGSWAEYLVLFLRIMAGVSLVKGLYHWAQVCGIGAPADGGFESHTIAWQTATVFFAVIDLVAAVGLWLAAAWGAVVWLTAVVSMAVVEVFFPQVYGSSIFIVIVETTLLAIYLWLAIFAAREQPK
jgi:predicted anti-sigma-YlaC factor YlaD